MGVCKIFFCVITLEMLILRSGALKCYTCVSDNIPEVSKETIQQSLNIPTYAESPECGNLSPMMVDMNLAKGVRVENCSTACVKIVSENRYFSIVMRGCLNRMYHNLQFPLSDHTGDSYPNICNKQTQGEGSMAETDIHTCLCSDNYCNGADTISMRSFFTVWLLSCLFLYHW